MKEEAFPLHQKCSMIPLSTKLNFLVSSFSCGEEDLDEFLKENAIPHGEEMMGKTYCWVTDEVPQKLVAFITLANDSIKTTFLGNNVKNRLNRPINNEKRGRSYPATLIGRLGVSRDYQGQGLHIGSQIIDFIKKWFRATDNKTGCRFIVVDAYNNERTMHFYEKNGFRYLFKSAQEEKDYYNLTTMEDIKTRLMYFDLKTSHP